MKIKNILALALIGGFALTGCDYNMDNFEGLDSKVELKDVQTLEYTLTDEDYTTLAGKASSMSSDKEIAAALAAAGKAKAFSADYPASVYMPYFLAYKGGRFYTLSDGSSIKVTYNNSIDAPAVLAEMAAATDYTVTAEDYMAVWGDEEKFIQAVTPATESKLASVIPTEGLEEGAYVAVSYNYAATEPSFDGGGDTPDPEQGYTSVLGSAALDEAVEVKGYVSAVCTQGIVLTDKTGSVLVYKASGHAVGDELTVSGTISEYNKGFQIDNGKATIEKTGATTVSYPAATVLDPATMTAVIARTQSEYLQYVTVTGKMSVSSDNKYYNILVDGTESADCSFYGITDEHKALVADGQSVTVYGWLSSISGGKHINIIATHVNEKPVIANGYTSVLGSAALDEAVEVKGYVSAVCTQGIVLTDKTGSVLVYKASGHAVGDELTVSGTISEYNKGFQIDNGKATIEKTGATTVSYPAATVLDPATMTAVIARTQSEYLQYVTVTGKMSVSSDNKYYNILVDGAADSDCSFYGITDEHKALVADGQTVTVTGWLSSISGGKHINIIATDVETAAAASLKAFAAPATEKRYALYRWDGSKFTAAEAAVLQPADYKAMGQDYGNLTTPDAYLPAYLKTTFPYAQADDVKNVVYRLFADSQTVWAAEQYLFDGAAWVKNANVEVVTDQFVRQSGKWVYNPSVVITLTPGKGQPLSALYFQAVTDWVLENVDKPMGAEKGGTYFVTSYGNNEYYTGCSAYQGNVDMRPGSARSQYGGESYQGQELVEAGVAFAGDGYTDMNDGAVVELMTKRLQYVMGKVLTQLHADAKPVEGIDVTYTINLGVYEGFNLSSCTHQLIYKVVGPAEFEFVEMKKL